MQNSLHNLTEYRCLVHEMLLNAEAETTEWLVKFDKMLQFRNTNVTLILNNGLFSNGASDVFSVLATNDKKFMQKL